MKALEWIEGSNKTALVFHIDTDGCCSAALVGKLLKKLGKTIDLYIGSIPALPDAVVSKLLYGMYDLVVFVDLSVDQQSEKIREIANNSKVLVIDHHTITENMNSATVCHMNPLLDGVTKYYPASKYIRDLFGLEEYDWIASIGVIGDSGVPDWKEFMTEAFKKYGWKTWNDPNARDTIPAEADEMIGSARILHSSAGAEKAFEILLASESIGEFFEKAGELRVWHRKVQQEIKKELGNFESSSEKVGSILIYGLRSEMNLGSALSTIVSNSHPDRTVLIYEKYNHSMKFHVRRGDGKLDLSRSVRDNIKGLRQSTGGGHRNAAGGQVVEDDWERFRSRLVRAISRV